MSTKHRVVYSITGREGRKFWNRVGLAFVNGDGSLTVKLEALPISGELYISGHIDPPSTEAQQDRPSVPECIK